MRFPVHHDVGSLQERIAEKTVGSEVALLQILDLFFVGGYALEPGKRRDHGEQQLQLGVLQHARLNEQGGFRGIEADGKPVDGDLQGVFGDRGRVFVMRRESMPIGDEEEALEFFLKLEPILESAKKMAQMETPGGPHAAQDSFALRHSKEYPPVQKMER